MKSLGGPHSQGRKLSLEHLEVKRLDHSMSVSSSSCHFSSGNRSNEGVDVVAAGEAEECDSKNDVSTVKIDYTQSNMTQLLMKAAVKLTKLSYSKSNQVGNKQLPSSRTDFSTTNFLLPITTSTSKPK